MDSNQLPDKANNWGNDFFESARQAGVTFENARKPKDRFIDANGLRFHYLEWGDPEAPVIVMLHGFAQTAHMWDFLALNLSGRYRVLSIDQRGHGDTDWDLNGGYMLSDYQDDLKAILSVLDLRSTTLIGFSMGGRNAYVFAANNPQNVKALVVIDSAPVHERAGVDRVRRFVNDSNEMESVEDFVGLVRNYNTNRSEDSLRSSLKHNLKQMDNGKWTWKYDKVLREGGLGELPSPSFLWNCIEKIQCAALLVRGEGSTIVSKETAIETALRLPLGRLEVVPKSGHLVVGDNPAYLERILARFLDPIVIG